MQELVVQNVSKIIAKVQCYQVVESHINFKNIHDSIKGHFDLVLPC